MRSLKIWVVRIRKDSGSEYHEFATRAAAQEFYRKVRLSPSADVRALGWAHITRTQLEASRAL